MRKGEEKLNLIYSLVWLGFLTWSGIQPYDRLTWFCEVAPVLIAWPLLFFTRKKFPLSPLLYPLICIHGIILMMGGKYTYARVPLGNWIQTMLGWERNPYDRIGHLAQGIVPVLVAREIFIRVAKYPRNGWLFFVSVCATMAVSVLYEFIEWWTALILNQGATEFLGTQGDIWDTQWDMFLATVGAIVSLLIFARLQDRQINKLRS
jgi:putative membrane protein